MTDLEVRVQATHLELSDPEPHLPRFCNAGATMVHADFGALSGHPAFSMFWITTSLTSVPWPWTNNQVELQAIAKYRPLVYAIAT